MGFLDDLKSTFEDAAAITADKAKDLANMTKEKVRDLTEITKLKGEISRTNRQLEELYLEIGKLMYAVEKEQMTSPVVAQCQTVTAALDKLTELNAKIQEVKNRGTVTEEEVAAVVPDEPVTQDIYILPVATGDPVKKQDKE